MPSRLVRLSFSLLFACICTLLGTSALSAQTNTTGLAGVITDPSGAVVPQVAVEISNPATGYIRVVKTGAKGEYSFDQITPGTYTVTVSAPNFAPQSQQIELLVATPSKVNFKLSVGTTEVVNVETSIAQLNTTDGTLGKAFNSQQVQNLPYLANNVTYLLSLQPGVLGLDAGTQTGGLNTDTRTGIVNGARQDQTNITLDGVDNNDQVFGYAFNGALRSTRDSVEEFRVTTTNANADAGRSSGAQVSLVTRSGTNHLHGSAYEYYRSSVGASNNWFNKQAQLDSGSSNIPVKVLEHTYGASLGAPIIKDKLFFFGAYEGFKQASDIPVTQTVPSTFGTTYGSGLVSGNVNYLACAGATQCQSTPNPIVKTLNAADIMAMDGRAGDTNCVPITACTAPSTDAASVAYFKQFPLANAPGASDPYNTGLYEFSSPAPLHQITNIARMDYNVTSRQTLFVRGNLQSDNQASSLQFLGLPPNSNIFGNNRGIAAGHTWTINDHATNNFRYGLTRLGNASRGSGSLPNTFFGAFSSLTSTTTTTKYLVTTNNYADDFTYVKGRHVIQVGANIEHISNAQYFDAPVVPTAAVTPELLATAGIANQGGVNGGTLDPAQFKCTDCGTVTLGYQGYYNNAIIANVGAIEQATSGTEFLVQNNSLVPQGAGVIPTHTFNNVEQEYYMQDQWKATSHLTFTFGIRYVHLGVPDETHGQEIAPTIALNTFLGYREAAAAAGNSYDTDISFAAAGKHNGAQNFWTPQKYNFAPRFAFAYATADNKSSARGGFAIAYDHFGSGIIDSYQSNQSSLLSLSNTNYSYYTDINSNPRFSGYRNIPPVAGATSALPFPYDPGDGNPFSFDYSINDKQETPYAETFNLTLEHQFPHALDVTASYVGRLGRHLIANLDVAQPTNLYDPGSNETYFQAAQAYDVLYHNGVQNVPNSGYFQDVFPNFSYNGLTGAQAYYAYFIGNIGNESAPLFAADTSASGPSPTQAFRFFFPETSSIFAQSSIANSNYNALQLSVRQALKGGVEYDVNYTYSKSMDLGSDPERNGVTGSPILNTFSPRQMYAPSDFDVRQNITANYTVPFPVGKGQLFVNNDGFLSKLIGGFQLNGVVHYSTGFPFSANDNGNYGTNFAFSSNEVVVTPFKTGGHRYIPSEQTETAIKGILPAQASADIEPAFVGQSGQRNNFRSDGYLSLDDGLSKSFATFREQRFRISVEVFNVLNTNRFNSVLTNGNSSNFGVYQNSGSTALLLQPRQMQFSGKYIF